MPLNTRPEGRLSKWRPKPETMQSRWKCGTAALVSLRARNCGCLKSSIAENPTACAARVSASPFAKPSWKLIAGPSKLSTGSTAEPYSVFAFPGRTCDRNWMKPLILITEDDPQIRRFLRATLTAEGYLFHEAVTAQDGIAQAGSRRPDLILLDLGLPDRDRLE